MKKFFTLIAAAMMAVAANADAIYSWSSAGPDAVTEKGGTIAYVNGENVADPTKADRVNYPNGDYYTVCLNGKKANIEDAEPSAVAGHMVLTLNEALKAGDKLEMTAYYNKGEEKKVSAWVVFEKGEAVASPLCTQDIAAGGSPELITVDVPAEAEGTKVIKLTRNDAGTNLFIVKLEVTRGGTSVDAAKAEAKVAPVKVMTANGVMIGNVNAAGQIVK